MNDAEKQLAVSRHGLLLAPVSLAVSFSAFMVHFRGQKFDGKLIFFFFLKEAVSQCVWEINIYTSETR